MILTRRPSYLKKLAISKKVNLSTPSPALCCAAHPAWPSCLSWAAQIPRLQDHVSWLYCNRGAYSLLPLGTRDCNAFLFLPLSKRVAKISYVSILSI